MVSYFIGLWQRTRRDVSQISVRYLILLSHVRRFSLAKPNKNLRERFEPDSSDFKSEGSSFFKETGFHI